MPAIKSNELDGLVPWDCGDGIEVLVTRRDCAVLLDDMCKTGDAYVRCLGDGTGTRIDPAMVHNGSARQS